MCAIKILSMIVLYILKIFYVKLIRSPLPAHARSPPHPLLAADLQPPPPPRARSPEPLRCTCGFAAPLRFPGEGSAPSLLEIGAGIGHPRLPGEVGGGEILRWLALRTKKSWR